MEQAHTVCRPRGELRHTECACHNEITAHGVCLPQKNAMRSRLLSLMCVCGLAGFAAAQLPRGAAPADAASEDVLAVTPEREAAAQTFAKLHHPELSKLLAQLKESNPAGYEQAVRDLFRTSERLARSQSRTPDRYEADLAMWKLDSRIRLLAARTAMGDSEETRAKLKELILQKGELQLRQMEAERDRITARLEKLNASIENVTARRDEAAERELDRLLNSARSRAPQKGQRAVKPETVRATEKDTTKGAQTTDQPRGVKGEVRVDRQPATRKTPQ